MTELEKLKKLTGESDDALLSLLLEEAEMFVCSYTNRQTAPDVLRQTIRKLAVIAYNRIGTEGETGRSEAGESYSFSEAPKEIFSVLNKYRIARCGGHAHEKVETDSNKAVQQACDER